jgi:hypothetical protein
MREEPNVYINGRPYVLREDERPYKNLQEYSGIDYQRLQRMEVSAGPASDRTDPAVPFSRDSRKGHRKGIDPAWLGSASGPAVALA